MTTGRYEKVPETVEWRASETTKPGQGSKAACAEEPKGSTVSEEQAKRASETEGSKATVSTQEGSTQEAPASEPKGSKAFTEKSPSGLSTRRTEF